MRVGWNLSDRVSLIGWSLGGVYARELARAHPSDVRQVITLASPFRNLEATNIPAFLLARRREHPDEAALRERLQAPLPVPVTAIYSRSDGIPAWQSCAVEPSAYSENIEVESSHLGIAHHPVVLLTIADRLAQAEGAWKPFRPPPAWRWPPWCRGFRPCPTQACGSPDDDVVARHEAACLGAGLGRRDRSQRHVGEASHFSPALIRVIA